MDSQEQIALRLSPEKREQLAERIKRCLEEWERIDEATRRDIESLKAQAMRKKHLLETEIFEDAEKLFLFASTQTNLGTIPVSQSATGTWYTSGPIVNVVGDIKNIYRQLRRAGLVKKIMRITVERTIDKRAVIRHADELAKKNIAGIEIETKRELFRITSRMMNANVVKSIKDGSWRLVWPEKQAPKK